MIDRDALIRAILDGPDDDAPRLAYADWLDVHGERERAELIRVQCELAVLPEVDERCPQLKTRERTLLQTNRDAWFGPYQSRRQKLRPTVSLEDVAEPSASASENDLFLSEMLRRVVDTLPEKARMVVILRYQEDLEPTEIARVLDMPLNTVKSHLRRSLSMLRDKLSRTLGEVTL